MSTSFFLPLSSLTRILIRPSWGRRFSAMSMFDRILTRETTGFLYLRGRSTIS